MNNIDDKKNINYWNPEWINDSFYDEYLEDNFIRKDQRYLFLPPSDTQQKHNHINAKIDSTCNNISKSVG